jgi:hypothetical protein
MEDNICEFCNKKFKNKYILKSHLTNSKSCLKTRLESNIFKCNECDKILSSKRTLNNHYETCIEHIKEVSKQHIKELTDKFENQLKEITNKYENQIKELQNQLASIARTAASKPIHIQNNNQRINNIINNLLPITEDHLKEQAQFLTLEHIKNGPSGYAKYALDYPLKDRVFCPDFSRKKINYKDSEGNLINDPEMKKLCEKLFKSIEEQNTILTNGYMQELQDKLNELNNDPNNEMDEDEALVFQQKSDDILNYFFKYRNQMNEIKKAAKGESTDIVNEFVKDVCAKVTT